MESSDSHGVFVIHYSKLVDRKDFLGAVLQNHDKKAFWITEKIFHNFESKASSSKKIVGVSERLVGMDLGINSRSLTRSRRKSRIEGKILFLRSYLSKKNTFSTGSLPTKNTMKESLIELQKMHLTALKLGLQQQKNWILVLEDDAVPLENAFLKIDQIIETKAPINTWISLNSGAGLGRTKSEVSIDRLGLFRVKPASTRCAVAYLISTDLASKIVSSAAQEGIPDWLPIDFYFQVMLRKFKSKSYWADSPYFIQGSETGQFHSGFEHLR
jgi:hypothetical protein